MNLYSYRAINPIHKEMQTCEFEQSLSWVLMIKRTERYNASGAFAKKRNGCMQGHFFI